MSRIEYRGYFIEYDPKPIPMRDHDYDFWHRDFNGPGDTRQGTAPSVEAAKAEIDSRIEELIHESK